MQRSRLALRRRRRAARTRPSIRSSALGRHCCKENPNSSVRNDQARGPGAEEYLASPADPPGKGLSVGVPAHPFSSALVSRTGRYVMRTRPSARRIAARRRCAEGSQRQCRWPLFSPRSPARSSFSPPRAADPVPHKRLCTCTTFVSLHSPLLCPSPSKRQPTHLAVLPRARPVLERAVRAHLDAACVCSSSSPCSPCTRSGPGTRVAAGVGSRGRDVDVGRDVEPVERLRRLLLLAAGSAGVVPRRRLGGCVAFAGVSYACPLRGRRETRGGRHTLLLRDDQERLPVGRVEQLSERARELARLGDRRRG